MEIALFGGSFDPPHVGHLLAAAYVLATEPVDELWFVPVFGHPLGKRIHAPFEHRAGSSELAVADMGLARARVSRVESELGVGSAFMLEASNTTLQSFVQVQAVTELPVLATIPVIEVAR